MVSIPETGRRITGMVCTFLEAEVRRAAVSTTHLKSGAAQSGFPGKGISAVLKPAKARHTRDYGHPAAVYSAAAGAPAKREKFQQNSTSLKK